jgi:ketosteroid isomerase-like protein
MKNLLVFTTLLFLTISTQIMAQNQEKEIINAMLDNWHKAASEANFNNYFGAMTDDAVYIGTDATENWNKSEFIAYAKPHFDQGKAWDFKPIDRQIFIDKSGKIAWFDELLNTRMKICRGSGVLEKVNGQWKIKHYVLSITIPNDNINAVIKIISPAEDALIEKLETKP